MSYDSFDEVHVEIQHIKRYVRTDINETVLQSPGPTWGENDGISKNWDEIWAR